MKKNHLSPLVLLLALATVLSTVSLFPQSAQAAEWNSPEASQQRTTPIPNRNAFHVLTYHDVFATLAQKQAVDDSGAITVDELARQFSWLRDNGYAVVSVQQIINSRNGGAPLPTRAVMLSFDDGYKSVHTHVLPLLRLFGYPATLAIVGNWIDSPDTSLIEYETSRTERAQFMSWAEIRDCLESGLVEIASHSFDMHHGVPSNPQGNKQPAAITRRFDEATKQYESEASYETRLRSDLARNSSVLKDRLGISVRTVVWPYGAYNKIAQRVAVEQGLTVGFTLDPGANGDDVSLAGLRRELIAHDTTSADIAIIMRPRSIRTERVVSIDVSKHFGLKGGDDAAMLSRLVDRVTALRPTTIVLTQPLQPGTGTAFFPNVSRAVHADVLNRIAWQLRTRAGVRVFVEDPGQIVTGTKELTRDLGRYVAFTGLTRDMQPNEPSNDEALALNLIRENRPTAELMRRLKAPVRCGDSFSPEKLLATMKAPWGSATAVGNWVLLRVAGVAARGCTLSWWQRFADVAAQMPEAMQRTIIEVDGAQPDTERGVVRPLLDAYAAGFRHLAYAQDDLQANVPDIKAVSRVISTETSPLKK